MGYDNTVKLHCLKSFSHESFFFTSYDLFFLSLMKTQQFLILHVFNFIWKCWDDPEAVQKDGTILKVIFSKIF